LFLRLLSYFEAPASFKAIAIACRLLFTLPPLPPGPLLSSPCLNSCITRPVVFFCRGEAAAMADSFPKSKNAQVPVWFPAMNEPFWAGYLRPRRGRSRGLPGFALGRRARQAAGEPRRRTSRTPTVEVHIGGGRLPTERAAHCVAAHDVELAFPGEGHEGAADRAGQWNRKGSISVPTTASPNAGGSYDAGRM
jgi:hypothetical protein